MVIAPTVTFLVNLSLSTGSVPEEWKKARTGLSTGFEVAGNNLKVAGE